MGMDLESDSDFSLLAHAADNMNPAAKSSKLEWNRNAVKFKLTKLSTAIIRYEIIYKNLLRDMRKFFATDFKELSNYTAKKQKDYGVLLISYIKRTFGSELETLGIPIEVMKLNLGSLINPKAMRKTLPKEDTLSHMKVV
jgi:hypothetical protein